AWTAGPAQRHFGIQSRANAAPMDGSQTSLRGTPRRWQSAVKTLQVLNKTPRAAVLAAQCLITAASATVLIWPEWTPGIPVLSLALLLLFAWSLISWKLAGGSLFSPYALFLTSAYLFNAGQAFLEVFG